MCNMHGRGIHERALKMRLEGKSYNEIYRELSVAKSTLRTWLAHTVLSDKAHQRLSARIKGGSLVLVKRNKMQTHIAQQKATKIRAEAIATIQDMNKGSLLLAGAVLYWAEGYKRPKVRDGKEITAHAISFVNSDPAMVKVFIAFLERVMDVRQNQINLTMRLYPHINEANAARFWLNVTGLKSENFRKTTNMISGASKGRRPFNRLPYGTLQVSVNSTPKFHQLMGFIEGVKAKLAVI